MPHPLGHLRDGGEYVPTDHEQSDEGQEEHVRQETKEIVPPDVPQPGMDMRGVLKKDQRAGNGAHVRVKRARVGMLFARLEPDELRDRRFRLKRLRGQCGIG